MPCPVLMTGPCSWRDWRGREGGREREGEREGGMVPVFSPVHTPIQTSCVTLKTDLVSVDGQDGGTHKEVKGELEVHHASPMCSISYN